MAATSPVKPKKDMLPSIMGEVIQPEELDNLCAEIRRYGRLYEQFLRADVRLNLQVQAIQRMIKGITKEGKPVKFPLAVEDRELLAVAAVMPLENARQQIMAERIKWQKGIEKLAVQLPVWPWCEVIRGIGALSLGRVIGETGNLNGYPNPAKVWKRMGLALVDGKIQRRVRAIRGKLTTEEENRKIAMNMGYSPSRRAMMHMVGDCLVKLNKDGYRALYEKRKQVEFDKLSAEKKGRLGHAHKRAMRYIEKRFLLDLWEEWKRV